MTILGLDLGTHTGWAIYRDGKITESGVADFSLKRGDSPGLRYYKMSRWLCERMLFFYDTSPDAEEKVLVGYEQPHMRGGAATEILYGMVAIVQGMCARPVLIKAGIKCDHTAVHTGTLKKFITGTGRASKEHVIEAVNKRVKKTITDDNEADAIAVALWAAENFGETP